MQVFLLLLIVAVLSYNGILATKLLLEQLRNRGEGEGVLSAMVREWKGSLLLILVSVTSVVMITGMLVVACRSM